MSSREKTCSKNPKVDAYLSKAERWRTEMEKLRNLVLKFPLTEELKWGKPCYVFQNSNVVLIVPFKDYCALLFNKGALLKSAAGFLIQPTENMQSSRQLRFTSLKEVVEMESVVKTCIQEAIEVEKAGLKVEYKKTSEFPVPAELKDKFDEDPAFKTAFKKLTPGRQRGYLLHFAAAKQSATRTSRIEKLAPQIFDGKGLRD